MAKAPVSQSTPRAKPRASKPKTEWHLICITRLGKVSMLRDMDLLTAREAYKRLRPDERPKTYIMPACGHGSTSSYGRNYGPTDDWLEKVEIIGPTGSQLNPWYGVEPEKIDLRHRHGLSSYKNDRIVYEACQPCAEAIALQATPKIIQAVEAVLPETDDARWASLYSKVPTAFWLAPETEKPDARPDQPDNRAANANDRSPKLDDNAPDDNGRDQHPLRRAADLRKRARSAGCAA